MRNPSAFSPAPSDSSPDGQNPWLPSNRCLPGFSPAPGGRPSCLDRAAITGEGGEPSPHDCLAGLQPARVPRDGAHEVVALERVDKGVTDRSHRGRPRHVPEQCDLAEVLPLVVKLDPEVVPRHLHLALDEDVEKVAGIT